MNPWIIKSIDLALQQDYLDQIQTVYPAEVAGQREIPGAVVQEIVNAHTRDNPQDLVAAIMKLSRSPVDDIRMGFLRYGDDAIDLNPQTVQDLGERLLAMPVDELLRRCRRAKATNTRMGNMFRRWIIGHPFPSLPRDQFETLDEVQQVDGPPQEILMLEGTPAVWKEFSNSVLGCGLAKAPDLLVKVNDTYVVGEAKWLGHFGGNQDNHFKEAVDFIHNAQGDATRIAVLDGVVWLDTNNQMNRTIRRVEAIALTALLLTDYLESLL